MTTVRVTRVYQKPTVKVRVLDNGKIETQTPVTIRSGIISATGGGTGTGASRFDELLDVNEGTPTDGNVVYYHEDDDTYRVGKIDGGTF
jgi:hypothetical protein